jgi:hypothetical protein
MVRLQLPAAAGRGGGEAGRRFPPPDRAGALAGQAGGGRKLPCGQGSPGRSGASPSASGSHGAASASGLQKMHPFRVQIFCSRTDAPSGLNLAGAPGRGLECVPAIAGKPAGTYATAGLNLAGAPGRGLECVPAVAGEPAGTYAPAGLNLAGAPGRGLECVPAVAGEPAGTFETWRNASLQKMHPFRVQIFCRLATPSACRYHWQRCTHSGCKSLPAGKEAPQGLNLAGAPGRGLKCVRPAKDAPIQGANLLQPDVRPAGAEPRRGAWQGPC